MSAACRTQRARWVETLRVLVYLPNLIDYTRCALLALAFMLRGIHPLVRGALYTCSVILDCCDGLAARKLHQTSLVGAALDMVLDRISTTLLAIATLKYRPQWACYAQMLVGLDIASHMIFVTKQQQKGAVESRISDNHKDVAPSEGRILSLYYQSRLVLSILCVSNETFFISAFVLVAYENAVWRKIALACLGLSGPGFIMKQLVNIVQLWAGIRGLVSLDVMRYQQRLRDTKI